jgi:MoaA/NifB/PqqE/SkfB family radical SAM enzyme
MDNLLKLIENYDDIFVFGQGTMGRTFFNVLAELGTNKSFRYCDSNAAPNAAPNAILLTPDEAVQRYPRALFCIGSITHSKAMRGQLINLGVPDENIAETPESIINEDKRRKFVPRAVLSVIEYHVTEHCNLNCAGCLHFSNLAKEELADLEIFKSDVTRIDKILKGGLPAIGLCGGEPLLHPQIKEFIECARQILPKASIGITTNGIILLDMPESFWESLQRNEIGISITKYPVKKINHEGILKKAKEYGVNVNTTVLPENWNKHIFDLTGKLSPAENFEHCPRANGNCVRIYKGRLYPCAVAGNAEHFNKKFSQNLIHTPNDSLDIYSDITEQDIFNFLAKPIPFCRYCDTKKLCVQPWKISKQEMDEYLE